jgi:hypothetical protein
MTEYIQGDFFNEIDNVSSKEVVHSDNDPGYTTQRYSPYADFLEDKKGEKFPTSLSIPVVERDFDPKQFISENFKYHKDKLEEHKIDLSGCTPIFYSHFRDVPSLEGMLFNPDIDMSFWRNQEGKLLSLVTFKDFAMIGSFAPSRQVAGGIDAYSTIFNYTVVDAQNFSRDMFLQITHKRDIDLAKELTLWVSSLKEGKKESANKVYEKLINPNIFKGNFWHRQIFNTLLKRNPLLSLAFNGFLRYFNQPTIGEKYPEWHKWLGDKF